MFIPKDIDSSLLRSFLAVVRSGSLSRAALELGRTQPAVSQQIRRLEDIAGQPLMARSAHGIRLTPAGERLMPYAERILTLVAEAQQQAAAPLSGLCRIGLIEDLAASLPLVLAEIAVLHPLLQLELPVAEGAILRQRFDAGKLEFLLGDPGYMTGIAPLKTVTRPLIWAGASGLRTMAGDDPVPLILFSQPCRWRAPMLAALTGHGRRWRIAFESTSLAAILAAVRAGLGVAALLPQTLGPGLRIIPPGEEVGQGLPVLPPVTLGLFAQSRSGAGDRLAHLATVLARLLDA